jgi:hypothetical protein
LAVVARDFEQQRVRGITALTVCANQNIVDFGDRDVVRSIRIRHRMAALPRCPPDFDKAFGADRVGGLYFLRPDFEQQRVRGDREGPDGSSAQLRPRLCENPAAGSVKGLIRC